MAEPTCSWNSQGQRRETEPGGTRATDAGRPPGGRNGLGEVPPSKYFLNILSDFKPDEAPLLSAAAASFRQRAENFSIDSPLSHCQPEGLPMAETAPGPYKIVQTPGLTVMLYERETVFR